MGLDTVELVIRFEDAFGIAISDEAAAQLTTPRQVTDYIMTQVATGHRQTCLSQQAFYFLREKCVHHLHISRNVFRPQSALESFLPDTSRRLMWAALKSEIGDEALPTLARPLWLFSTLSAFTLIVSVYVAIFASNHFDLQLRLAISLSLTTAIITAYATSVLTRPLKKNFRTRYRNVADIVKYLALHSPHTFKKRNRAWTREQVAQQVREIIIDETGTVDFTEDSHFIRDMHLD